MTSSTVPAVPIAPEATLTAPARRAKRHSGQRKWAVIRLISPVVLLALWQLGSAVGLIPQDVLPAPSLIVEAGIELIRNGQLADALQVSGLRVGAGLLLGGVIGVGWKPRSTRRCR
ncbi:aliphatic sulfonates transport permease SsuC [Mycolicibacterium mageritense DSM 44476 = CIP 104973]|nr:aliphatic sulfonates transport permease SsuC [Mycolicibacterium mageritense DSM 44476 = CIP 104973]